jgi:hypothetical protein
MPVTPVRAGDVVVRLQRLTDTNRHRLLTYIEVCQSRHQRSRVEIIHPLFKEANGEHLAVHVHQFLNVDTCRRRFCRNGHGA